MSVDADAPIDLIRWTFSIDPARREAVEGYLTDLGLDVHVRGESQVIVLWDEPEPDDDPDAVIEGLWEVHGSPIEVTHEEFRRRALLAYHVAEDGPEKAVA